MGLKYKVLEQIDILKIWPNITLLRYSYLGHATPKKALCYNSDDLLYPSRTVYLYKTENIEELRVNPFGSS